MATIGIEATEEGTEEPEGYGDRARPLRNGSCYEFNNVSEEELAFWNTLDREERRKMSDES